MGVTKSAGHLATFAEEILNGRLHFLCSVCLSGYRGLQTFTGYLRLTLVFMWNSALREKFNFWFSRDFCWYKQNSHFDGSRAPLKVIPLTTVIVDSGDSSDYCNCWSSNLDNTQNINCFASYTQDGFLCFTVFENL